MCLWIISDNFHIYRRVKRGVVCVRAAIPKSFHPLILNKTSLIHLFRSIIYIFFPNTNFWKMNMNMAYPPWTYLLLYLRYGHLANTHFMDFHPRSQFQPRILCLPVPIYLMHFSVIWRTNSPDFFWKGIWVNLLLKMEKRGTQHTEVMKAVLSNKGSDLRRFWESGLLEVVYDISSHFLWSFHFTFQEMWTFECADPCNRTGPTNHWCRGLKAVSKLFWFYRVVWTGLCSFVDAYNLHSPENWHGTSWN